MIIPLKMLALAKKCFKKDNYYRLQYLYSKFQNNLSNHSRHLKGQSWRMELNPSKVLSKVKEPVNRLELDFAMLMLIRNLNADFI